MKCITIDDEPLAHKIILNYCRHLDHVEVVQNCHSALEAMQFLATESVDLVFLDLQMPKLHGLDFLRVLPSPPMVIITTAHQEFALESYEFDVVDYLLKPFSFERFLKAVTKAGQQRKQQAAPPTPSATPLPPATDRKQSIFIKGDKKTHQVFLQDILFLKSAGSYVRIYLQDEVIMTLDRMANFELRLPAEDFLRVHKSYMVAVSRIKTIEGNRIFLAEHEIPIGQTYKQNVNQLFN